MRIVRKYVDFIEYHYIIAAVLLALFAVSSVVFMIFRIFNFASVAGLVLSLISLVRLFNWRRGYLEELQTDWLWGILWLSKKTDSYEDICFKLAVVESAIAYPLSLVGVIISLFSLG